MTVFLDSNLIIDILLPNEKFLAESKAVLNMAHSKNIEFYISAASVTDIFYIVNKKLKDAEKSKQIIKDILTIVNVAGVDETCVLNALNSSWKDFEDCVQHEVAWQIHADCIVTRDEKDFINSSLVVLSPTEFLKRIE